MTESNMTPENQSESAPEAGQAEVRAPDAEPISQAHPEAPNAEPATQGQPDAPAAETDGRRDGVTMLEARGVSKYFGSVNALKDITLKVNGGEVTCVLGDNGAGKSTLIKILS